MTSSLTRSILLAGTALLLSACCSNVTDDPRAGGLAGGICGNATGAYDQRIAGLRTEVDALDAANARLRGRLGRERAVANDLSGALQDKRERLASLDRQLARKRAATGRRQADQQELQVLGRSRDILVEEITELMAKAGDRERSLMAVERGMREASDTRTRQRLAREADPVLSER